MTDPHLNSLKGTSSVAVRSLETRNNDLLMDEWWESKGRKMKITNASKLKDG